LQLLDNRSFFGTNTDDACQISHGCARLHPSLPSA
jgi:hypothetical protein